MTHGIARLVSGVFPQKACQAPGGWDDTTVGKVGKTIPLACGSQGGSALRGWDDGGESYGEGSFQTSNSWGELEKSGGGSVGKRGLHRASGVSNARDWPRGGGAIARWIPEGTGLPPRSAEMKLHGPCRAGGAACWGEAIVVPGRSEVELCEQDGR